MTPRSALVLLIGLAAIAFVGEKLVRTAPILPRDFVEYWSAGAVAVRGGNPYDPVPLLAAQQEIDPSRTGAVMMWNPPWSLAAYMPLGLIPPKPATLLWVGLQLLAVLVAADLLWRTYAGGRRRWAGQLAAVAFVGTWWMVLYCQNTGLLVLGLAGFAFFWKADRPAVAGAFAALTALKPHLLAPFGVLLVVGLIDRRGRIALASGSGVLAAALAAVCVVNPSVVSQYLEAVRNPAPDAEPLSSWALPVASYWLRVAIDRGTFAWQFAPCAAACAGLVAYRLWRGKEWDWPRELPLVVWVSVLATPYGGWIFDLTVLLVPVVAVAARLSDLGVVVFVVAQFGISTASLKWAGGLHQFWWVAPAVLAVCFVGRAVPDAAGEESGTARPTKPVRPASP